MAHRFNPYITTNTLQILCCTFLSLFLLACAQPVSTSLQSFVPKAEIDLVRDTREGMSFLARRRYFEATALLYRTYHAHPYVPAVGINLAIALRQLGAHEPAEQILHEILKKDQLNTAALSTLAVSHLQQLKQHTAEELFERAVAIELKKGKFDEAAAIASAASEQFDTYRFRDTAICFAEEAVGLLPNANTRAQVTRLWLSDFRFAQVHEYIDEQAQGGRGNVELQLVNALALLGLDKADKALKVTERLVLQAKKKPEFLPEIQVTRLVALLLKEAAENKVPVSTSLLNEEDQELFFNAFMGEANVSELARYWPPVMRTVLRLQEHAAEQQEPD